MLPIYIHEWGQNIRNTSEYNAAQYEAAPPPTMTSMLKHNLTRVTVSTKPEHYRHHKSRLYGRTVVLGVPNKVDTECIYLFINLKFYDLFFFFFL